MGNRAGNGAEFGDGKRTRAAGFITGTGMMGSVASASAMVSMPAARILNRAWRAAADLRNTRGKAASEASTSGRSKRASRNGGISFLLTFLGERDAMREAL